MLNPVNLLDQTQSGIIIQNHDFIDQGYVNLLHKKNKMIFAYTVNTIPGFMRMLQSNVDGIFTDYPDVLKSLLDRISLNALEQDLFEASPNLV
jgi:glycerophosphoryl diester phosphodiesterase